MAHINLAIPGGTRLQPVPAVTPQDPEDERGTLVVDSRGVIISCGKAAAAMLGGSASNMVGRTIWRLITSMTASNTSASYNARYIAAMSTDNQWRRFPTVTDSGRRFPVELSIACLVDGETDLFQVTLRHPSDEPINHGFHPI
jgi:PAS domain S-box-containing protein